MGSKSIVDHFSDLPDPPEDDRRHLLIDIIVRVICAAICGAEKWDDVESFGNSKESWLKRFLRFPHGTPSHDTIARVFSRLGPKASNDPFVSWVAETINIDGKTSRRSHDRSNNKPVELFFDDTEQDKRSSAMCDYIKSVDHDHGRVEIRECWGTDRIDWLEAAGRYQGPRRICAVKSQRIIDGQATTRWRERFERTGVSRPRCTGYSTEPSVKTSAASARITPRRTSRLCATSP